MLRPGRPPQPAGKPIDDLQLPPKAKKVEDTPPRRKQKKTTGKTVWTQPRTNTRWSRTVVR